MTQILYLVCKNGGFCTQVKQLEEQSRKLASGSLGTTMVFITNIPFIVQYCYIAPPLLNSMEDDVSERAFYFEAHESYSLTSADSKEDISMLKDTNKTRAQEQWEKIRYSVPFLLRMNTEAVRGRAIVTLLVNHIPQAKNADASVDSITGQQTLGSEMIDTVAHQ